MSNFTKQQHQLHRGYARAYSESHNDTDLVYYDKHGTKLPLQSTKSLTVEPLLYETPNTDQNRIENWFSSKEGLWTESLKAAGRNESLTKEDHYNLIEFAFLTALRQKETIAIYKGFYKCFGRQNGEDLFKESLASTSSHMSHLWFNSNPKMGTISLSESGRTCHFLTSDNPVIFIDECEKHHPLWAAPLKTFRGFFFPVSSTRLFISFTDDDIPELVTSNNVLQRAQARDAIFVDESKELMLVSECRKDIPEDKSRVNMFLFYQTLKMEDGSKLPLRGIISSIGDEISIVPDSGPMASKAFRVYPDFEKLNFDHLWPPR